MNFKMLSINFSSYTRQKIFISCPFSKYFPKIDLKPITIGKIKLIGESNELKKERDVFLIPSFIIFATKLQTII